MVCTFVKLVGSLVHWIQMMENLSGAERGSPRSFGIPPFLAGEIWRATFHIEQFFPFSLEPPNLLHWVCMFAL